MRIEDDPTLRVMASEFAIAEGGRRARANQGNCICMPEARAYKISPMEGGWIIDRVQHPRCRVHPMPPPGSMEDLYAAIEERRMLCLEACCKLNENTSTYKTLKGAVTAYEIVLAMMESMGWGDNDADD